MIRKFSENINEDYFSKLANRKDTSNVRKENTYKTNVKDMKDLYGDSIDKPGVYVADRLLEINGEILFDWEDVKDFEEDGWRLPSMDDIKSIRRWDVFKLWRSLEPFYPKKPGQELSRLSYWSSTEQESYLKSQYKTQNGYTLKLVKTSPTSMEPISYGFGQSEKLPVLLFKRIKYNWEK